MPPRKVENMTEHPMRKWPRLRNYDYSSNGFYFLTICTEGRKSFLSEVIHPDHEEVGVKLSELGRIAESYLKTIPGMDKYVIMPNHVHMIIHKTNGKPISSDVRSFKSLTTKAAGKRIWQDYYYDHVIRDEQDYLTKWNYIDNNPAKWADDEYHP